MNYAPIKLPNVQYEMLVELSKKKRKNLTEYLMELVEEKYNQK